jgi:excisionase family DNA binding protein
MNFLTVKEFAERMKMNPLTIRLAIRRGEIYATKFTSGKRSRYRIAESELERLYLKGICEEKKH